MKLLILILLFWCTTSFAKREKCTGIAIQSPPYKLICEYDIDDPGCYYHIDITFSIENDKCKTAKYHTTCLNKYFGNSKNLSSEMKCYNNLKSQYLNKTTTCVLKKNCVIDTIGYTGIIVLVLAAIIFIIIMIIVAISVYCSNRSNNIYQI